MVRFALNLSIFCLVLSFLLTFPSPAFALIKGFIQLAPDPNYSAESLKHFSHLDTQVKNLVVDNQALLIHQICSKNEIKLKESPRLLEVLLERSHSDADLDNSYSACLLKMSTLWKTPSEVLELFTNSPTLDAMNQHFLVMSTIKHLRSSIARAYFQTRAPQILEEETGLNSDQLNPILVGYGFNRLFSPKNFMGATAASDIDFNFLYDDTQLQNFSLSGPALKERLQKSVYRMRDEIEERYSMELDIGDFTIQALSEVFSNIEEQDETTLNFYATLLDHTVHLLGNPLLLEKLLEKATTAIGPDKTLRIFKQYVGQETSKVSLGVIRNITRIRQIAQEQGEGSHSFKLSSRYSEFTLGMPESEKHEEVPTGQSLFPSKEIIRLWDFDPTDQQAHDLYLVVTCLQDLKIRQIGRKLSREFTDEFVVNTSGALENMSFRLRQLERTTVKKVDRKYSAIRVRNFAEFFNTLETKRTLQGAMEFACKKKLVSRVCPELEDLFTPKASIEDAKKLEKIGLLFFSELVTTALDVALRIKPATYSEF